MLTENLMRQYDACWGGQDYAKVIARHGTDALTPRQVAADEEISLSHRIWALATALAHRTGSEYDIYSLRDEMTGDSFNTAEMRNNLERMLDMLGPDADGWTEAAP